MLAIYNQYPTVTVFMALFLGAVFTMILMPFFIKFLRSRLIGQQVRDDGPQTHLVKQGTPTMGGVVMIVAMVLAAVLLEEPTAQAIAIVVAVVLTGALGLFDDVSKVVYERSLGLTPKAKLVGQFGISALFCLVAVNWLGVAPTVSIPFIVNLDFGILTTVIPVDLPGLTTASGGFEIPWIYLIFVMILLAGLSNATNLTDGLDGLAAGTVMVAMAIMAMICYTSNMLAPAIIAAAIVGTCIGFLWFNSYPADIFMGDTGSLALGMAFGCLAVVSKTEVISLIIGGLFVVEALSVMIQVMYYKRTKKRIFLMAPLHHHFEKKGWSEVKVVVRFWIISGALGAIGFLIYFAQIAS